MGSSADNTGDRGLMNRISTRATSEKGGGNQSNPRPIRTNDSKSKGDSRGPRPEDANVSVAGALAYGRGSSWFVAGG